MLVGLNGAGKTAPRRLASCATSAAAIRTWRRSTSTGWPIEQLRVLGEQLGVPVHPTRAEDDPSASIVTRSRRRSRTPTPSSTPPVPDG
jgi:signal recognition particle GTPase